MKTSLSETVAEQQLPFTPIQPIKIKLNRAGKNLELHVQSKRETIIGKANRHMSKLNI